MITWQLADEKVMLNMQTSSDVKQFKALRSLCLKIVSLVLNKYEDHEFGCEFWNLFFASVKHLVDGFKQEGSSSEKPSSLFSCFVAMSRSHRLVSLLSREKNLVPDIFSILSVMSASKAIVSCVLTFVENLLNLDCELNDEEDATKRVLLPNLGALICSLHRLFQSDSATKRYGYFVIYLVLVFLIIHFYCFAFMLDYPYLEFVCKVGFLTY
jgi:U3 small nucleolar RNA-associated protein 20